MDFSNSWCPFLNDCINSRCTVLLDFKLFLSHDSPFGILFVVLCDVFGVPLKVIKR